MAAELVPLVPRTELVLDELVGSTQVAVIRNLPLFAWVTATLLVRIEANTLAAGVHSCHLELLKTAPTPEQPDDAFAEGVAATIALTSTDAAGLAKLAEVTKAVPYADLVATLSNTAALPVAGSVSLSIDLLVRGRSFDRIGRPAGAGRGEMEGI